MFHLDTSHHLGCPGTLVVSNKSTYLRCCFRGLPPQSCDPAQSGCLARLGCVLAMPPKKAAKGAKAKKQQGGKAKSRGAGNRRNNPKAFAAASGTKAQARNAYRALEKQEKKYHVSLTDRSVDAVVRLSSLRHAAPPSALHARHLCRCRSRRRLWWPWSVRRAWARAR